MGIGTHVVERGLGALNGRFYLPGVYYLATMFLSLFPWCFFLPGALKKTTAEKQTANEPDERAKADDSGLHYALLMGWFIAPFLIFSFYKTQLPHYILPGFPAFFLLLTRSGRVPELATKFQRQWFAVTATFFVAVNGALAWAWACLPWQAATGDLRMMVLYAFVWLNTLLLIGLIAWKNHFSWHYWLTPLLLLAVSMNGFCLQVRKVHPVAALLPALKSLPADAEGAMSGFAEPSVVFYHGGHWLYGNLKKEETPLPNFNKPEEALRWLNQAAAGKTRALLLATKAWTLEDYFKEWRAGRGGRPNASEQFDPQELEVAMQSLGTLRVKRVSGYNAARSTWEELILLVKKG